MDDAKIDLIAREVLTSLKKAHAHDTAPAPCAPAKPEPEALPQHPSLRLLSVRGGVVGSPCVIEPEKVCVGSLKCRALGH